MSVKLSDYDRVDLYALQETLIPATNGESVRLGDIAAVRESVRELNRALGLSLPTDGPKTLNGLILEQMEDIPEPGTSLRIANFTIEVLQSVDNAVKTVRISPLIDPTTPKQA